MNKLPILTVVYHESPQHYYMAMKTWNSLPPGSDVVAVVNKRLEGVEYPSTIGKIQPSTITYLENDENCLAKAWNMGLKYMFNKGYKGVIVSGLDSMFPRAEYLEQMYADVTVDNEAGLISAIPFGLGKPGYVEHGDGSFSLFAISREAFYDVGDFDERYKPAYFEDNDYLERMWMKGYRPQRSDVYYYHITQGTVKFGTEVKQSYPVYMQRNLELFKADYGKVPDHLSPDIRFS